MPHDRNNRRALVLLVPWLQERGRLPEAAAHAVHLAELFDELYPQYGGTFCRNLD